MSVLQLPSLLQGTQAPMVAEMVWNPKGQKVKDKNVYVIEAEHFYVSSIYIVMVTNRVTIGIFIKYIFLLYINSVYTLLLPNMGVISFHNVSEGSERKNKIPKESSNTLKWLKWENRFVEKVKKYFKLLLTC